MKQFNDSGRARVIVLVAILVHVLIIRSWDLKKPEKNECQ